MVSILPSGTPSSLIGQDVGRALQSILPQAVQQGYNRGMLQKNLGDIRNLANSQNSNPLDITLAAMQAGAGIPGSERYLGQIIPMLQQLAMAKSSQNAPLAGERNIQRDRTLIEPLGKSEQLPNFLGNKESSQFFPTNLGPQGGPGNVPQESTQRVKEPLLATSEYPSAAKKLAQEKTAAGIPTTAREALAEVKENEKAKAAYNDQIDKELQQRTQGQQIYGDRSVDYLTKLFPENSPYMTDELKSIFQKKGEIASRRGDSEADINRYLANEAKLFKNAIVNAEKDVSAPRLLQTIASKINGNYKGFEQAASDVRKHLQPLIDLGLFDTARRILSNKGYGIEEREQILHPLDISSISSINQLPNVKSGFLPGKNFKKDQINLEDIKSTLFNIKKNDPDFSPVLARKAFEDKGYDWRSFKDAWNEALNEGLELTDDQRIQSGNLDTPPLNQLDRLLEGLNLIGR